MPGRDCFEFTVSELRVIYSRLDDDSKKRFNASMRLAVLSMWQKEFGLNERAFVAENDLKITLGEYIKSPHLYQKAL